MKYNQLLREHGFIILNNLKQFNKSPELIDELIKYLPESEISLMLPMFELAKEYFERNNEFPASRYFLSSQYSDFFQYLQKPYSEDIYNDVLRTLRLQHVSFKSIQEIGQGRLESALTTLSEFNNIRSNKKERFNPDKYMDFYTNSKNKGIGMMTGITELDLILRGYDYSSLNVIAAPPACGKALTLDTKIITPNGITFMKDIKVGDGVLGSDGDTYQVTGVFPQGKKQVYRLTLEDSNYVDCCIDHLWQVDVTSKNSVRFYMTKVLTTQEILDGLNEGNTYRINKYLPYYDDIYPTRKIESVVSIGYEKEMQCISVNSPDNLFMVNDFILTHNTTLGVSIAYNGVMNENKNFVFFSLEVKDEHVYYSFLSRHSRELGFPIPASEMKKAKMNKQQELWYEQVGSDFNDRIRDKLFIVTQDDFIDFSPVGIEKMMYEFDSICRERGEQLDGFVFDYLQLTKYYKPPTIKDEKEVMNYYTRYLLELATTFNGRGLIGILLAQLNRTGSEQLKKNKDATLFSFAEANELERSAHTALVLYASDEMKMSGNVNFYLVKNRIGETKSTPTTVVCDFPHYRMGNTSLASIVTPENDFLLDTALAGSKEEEIQNQLDSLDSLL